MRNQVSLFQEEVEEQQRKMNQERLDEEKRKKAKSNTERYPVEYCEKVITTDPYIWDMRCWVKYGDDGEMQEVIESILNEDGERSINSGHSMFVIRIACRLHDVSIDTIKKWMLKNKNLQYKYRIVPCLVGENTCPKFIENGRMYGKGLCDGCEKTQDEIAAEKAKHKEQQLKHVLEFLERHTEEEINIEEVVINGKRYAIKS